MIEFKLPAMTCNHCVRTVTEAVRQVDAQARVEVDLAEKQVRIESARPAEEFRQALAAEGYAPA